jgi:hypothetical protein
MTAITFLDWPKQEHLPRLWLLRLQVRTVPGSIYLIEKVQGKL